MKRRVHRLSGAMVRLTVSVSGVAIVSACPIGAGDVPTFGQPCTGECASGYFCDERTSACLPGEAPPPEEDPLHATIVTFAVDDEDVRPDEDVTFSWTTTNTVTCTLDTGDGATAVDLDGTATVTLTTPGDVTATLTCVGEDEEPESDTATVHVRNVVASLTVASDEDAAAAADVDEVDGDLVVTGSVTGTGDLALATVHGDVRVFGLDTLVAVTLGALTTVDGDVIVRGNESLESASFPALAVVGGDLTVARQAPEGAGAAIDPVFTTFAAPELVTVGGAVALSAYEYPDVDEDGFADSIDTPFDGTLPLLADIDLSSLATVGGSFRVEQASVADLDLPAIDSIGGLLVFYDVPSLTGISWPVETLGAGFVFESNDSLASVSFPQLTTIGNTRELIGDAYQRTYELVYSCTDDRYAIGDVFFVANDADGDPCFFDEGDNKVLEQLALPALTTVAGRVFILGTGLTDAELPSLVSAGGITARRNNFLASLSLPALETIGRGGLFLDNGDNIEGLQALREVDGELSLAPSTLPVLSALESVGGALTFDFLTQAQAASFPALESVGQLSLTEGEVTSLVLPSLHTVAQLVVTSADVTSLDLCALTTATSVQIDGTGLTTLDGLASANSIQTLRVRDNASLPACLVDDLAARSGASLGIDGNSGNSADTPVPCEIDDDAVCGS